jgi:endonuclease/exonuclease/phosphatase family metal-dependent hydrolase
MENISTKNKFLWFYFALITINVIFGLQILNTFISLLNNFLRERPNISLIEVGIYALVTFALVFLAGFLFKIFAKRVLFLVLVIGIGIIRFIIQVNPWPPLNLAISALGTVLWIVSFIYFISLVQQNRIELFPVFFPAMFLGFAVVTGIYGLFGTWDIVWRDNPFITFCVLILIFIQVWLAIELFYDTDRSKIYSDGNRWVFYTLISVMPFIYLQLFRFQNIAAFSATTGFRTVLSMAVIVASNIAAFSLVYLFEMEFAKEKLRLRFVLTVIAIFLILLSFWPEVTGILYILQVIIGNLALWWLMYVLVRRAVFVSGGVVKAPQSSQSTQSIQAKKSVPWKNTSAFGVSGILFFIFAFVYYGSYDMKLPLESWTIPILTAILIGFCGLFAVLPEIFLSSKEAGAGSSTDRSSTDGSSVGRSSVGRSSTDNKSSSGRSYRSMSASSITGNGTLASCKKFLPIYLLLAVLIFPLMLSLPPRNYPDVNIKRDSIRIMDYNIHQGFNVNGYLDLEGIARVIESNGADVVALQEVSRGWLVNGSADTYEWLADRLNMQYRLFVPASDLIWGNAILSRYPLKLLDSDFLPRLEAPLRRSFLLAEVQLENYGNISDNINILCTHLHHIEGEGFIREKQVQTLLEEWDGLARTAIMGDFNAVTGEPEIAMMHDAGLIDSQLSLGKEGDLTWVHYEPHERIDYIWVTPDLEISNLVVPYSTASDHLPVVVDVK